MEKKRVLIIEDSQMVRRLIRRELEDSGYEVYEAENGKVGLEQIVKVEPDVITMDIEMPEMNGYETCQKIRGMDQSMPRNQKKISELPVIFLTANSNMEFRQRAFQSGASEYLTKPPVQGEITNTLNRLFVAMEDLAGLTVLLVDHDPISRKLITLTLKHDGLKLLEASNGLEAVKLIKDYGKEIDLVMTNKNMPMLDGIHLCKHIRKDLALLDLPIIFLLNNSSELDDVGELFRNGATDYLLKPFVKDELFARLKVHFKEKLLKEDLRDKVRKLKEADKLKDDFLSIASHDLRSPLNGILGFADLLKMDQSLSTESQEYVDYIKASGLFLLHLIEDLLDLSRIQSQKSEFHLQDIYLMDILHSCKETLSHMASPKDIKMTLMDQTGANPKVTADKYALTQIVNNLISNAIKFTPNHGSVEISINPSPEKLIRFEVKDTGIGIKPEMIPHLFERFTKASQAGTAGEKSTGLGMSITKDLVEQLGGSIQVQSEVGKGSCFVVLLPAA